MTYPISHSELARREELSRLLGQPFELESLIATGGQAEVWRGRDTELGRPVAIKVLRADTADRPDFAERLRREAVAIARIQSPHVVPILQLVSRRGTSFLVMPFVEGETVAAALTRGPLAENDAIRVMREVALGLAEAHAAGVIHRDVKPSNILLDSRMQSARLVDFGVAKALGAGEPALTATGVLVGSAVYMSPEQFDTSASVGTPSDIYSLGIVAFESVTGKPPFFGKTAAMLAMQHCHEAAPSLAGSGLVQPRFGDLIDRCLSKDPAARPVAREVANTLVGTSHHIE